MHLKLFLDRSTILLSIRSYVNDSSTKSSNCDSHTPQFFILYGIIPAGIDFILLTNSKKVILFFWQIIFNELKIDFLFILKRGTKQIEEATPCGIP